jgi:ribosomal protein S12 methylthiotransferase accessory factor
MSTLNEANPIDPMVGIVTYLTEVLLNRGDPDLFVAAAQGSNPEGGGSDAQPNTVIGSGAGLTWESARGAALGECLERYASASIDRPTTRYVASYDDLVSNGLRAHHPGDWALFDHRQDVPFPTFTTELPILWTEGVDLVSSTPIFLPACMTYLTSSALLGEHGARVLAPAISTGCACASTRDTALLKGLYELIERDAFMIVWRNRLEIPEIAIDSGTSVYPIYQERFERPGLEYRIWQTSLDLPVPSFFGMLFDRRGSKTRIVVGGSANWDAEAAVLKTLCELVQGLSWLDFLRSSNRSIPTSFEELQSFTDRAVLYASQELDEAFSFLESDRPAQPLSAIPSRSGTSAELLAATVDELAAKSFAPAAVDLTTEDIAACGFTVIRAMVAGLETMEGDYRLQLLGGKRWRTIPMELGYRQALTSIAEMNPFPHPYP